MFGIILGILGAGISPAQAGEKIGNGGGAWACTQSNGSWKWLRQIDLYEGVTEYHLPIREQSVDPLTQAETAIVKLSRVNDRLARDYSFALMNVRANMKFVRAELEIISDSLYRIRPYATECAGGKIEYVQIANFKEDGEVIVREDVWNHPDFSAAEKAALYLHEAIYADLREKFDEANSTRARHLVALLLSDLEGSELNDEMKRVLDATPDPTTPTPMKFVSIPAGTYTVGVNRDALTERQVIVAKPFEIMTTEVTEFQHYALNFAVSDSRYSRRLNCPHNFVLTGTVPHEKGYCPNLPAYYNFERALAFANRMTETDRNGYRYRLPTSDEWEIAARGHSSEIFGMTSDPAELERYAVISSADLKRTQPMDVGSKRPNSFGIYDMLGNQNEIATGLNRYHMVQAVARGCHFSDEAKVWANGVSRCAITNASSADTGPIPWGAIRLIREKRQ